MKSLMSSLRLLQVVNSFFKTCSATSRVNTTCGQLVCRLATTCEVFTCVVWPIVNAIYEQSSLTSDCLHKNAVGTL